MAAIPFFDDYSSYPTYEEWKPLPQHPYLSKTFCSYPTYEEWKQTSIHGYVELSCHVLILPMRNGNLHSNELLCRRLFGSYPTYEE